MSIEQELIAHLEAVVAASPQQGRNLRIVLFFYGFGGAVWPTLDETAEAFGLGTRERVRQILGSAFAEPTRVASLPVLQAVSRLIRSRPFWVAGELAAAVAERTGDERGFSMRALFRLMQALDLAPGYDVYDHNLERLTRSQLAAHGEFVLVRKDMIARLRRALIAARRLSLGLGLISTGQLAEAVGSEAAVDAVSALLAMDPACIAWSERDRTWWVLEAPDNLLVGLAAKAFAAACEVTPARLAEAVTNALSARVGRQRQAGCAEVEAWIRISPWFRHVDRRVSFLGQAGQLTPVERELVAYLSARESADYSAIKAHLHSRGVPAWAIAKAATQSPAVHVDRSGGVKAYRYSLVGRGHGETRDGEAAAFGR